MTDELPIMATSLDAVGRPRRWRSKRFDDVLLALIQAAREAAMETGAAWMNLKH
jgi:hypothetical protein